MGMAKKPVKKASSFFPSNQAAAATASESDGGGLIADYGVTGKEISYEDKRIPLSSIRTNPDNEIFRDMDDEEDIKVLSEDIKRNGLLHNLVVFPSKEDDKPVYVLLSGERRYRALLYLAKTDDAKWNIVECKVITTDLSANERKVLLYSANLQIRGGFGDEKIRRKAVAEFVACLQKEPYNLTLAKAKAAIREISPMSNKSIDNDLRIENELDPTLKELLDAKFLLRRESDDYLRLTPEEQRLAASRFAALKDIDSPELEQDREIVRRAFRDRLLEVAAAMTPAEAEKAMKEALDFVDSEIEKLQNMAPEKRESEATSRKASAVSRNAITKNLPDTTKRLQKLLGSKNIKKNISSRSVEVRDEAVQELSDLIDLATRLKTLIEETN